MMQKLLLCIVSLTFLLLDLAHGERNANSTTEVPKVTPVEGVVPVNGLEDVVVDEVKENLKEKVEGKCEHTDYRSYVNCLLKESKREKRQGYGQQCFGAGCSTQSCSGNGCLPVNQQQCIGTGCAQSVQQLPCSGTSCAPLGYNCGGNGCIQIGQNCNGPSCGTPPCTGPFCGDHEIRKELGNIRQDLGLMRAQNERLIKESERATSFILQLVKKPDQSPPTIGHNLTTNIDIKNYMNNHNIANVPDLKPPVEKDDKKENCCVVVRPKTCRRTPRPPYIGCGHKRHRTCGTICSEKRVVYSHVRPGCTGDDDENCVSYHPHPPSPTTYSGYPPFGYYQPIYYPIYPPILYAPPQIPTYTPPCDCEGCEDCVSEVETEDCEDTDADCRPSAKKDKVENDGIRSSRDVPLNEILQVKKEAREMKRSEDQLAASIDMLQEAVKLEELDEAQRKREEFVKKSA